MDATLTNDEKENIGNSHKSLNKFMDKKNNPLKKISSESTFRNNPQKGQGEEMTNKISQLQPELSEIESHLDSLDFASKKLIKEYYELATLTDLPDSAAERIGQILESAQTDATLSFLINEIDCLIAPEINSLYQQEDFLLEVKDTPAGLRAKKDEKVIEEMLDETKQEHFIPEIKDTPAGLHAKKDEKVIEEMLDETKSANSSLLTTSTINKAEFSVYECEINLKFRIIEEKSILREREHLLALLLDAFAEGPDEFLETLKARVKAHELSELETSPQMRRQLIRLRNSSEYNQALDNLNTSNRVKPQLG